MNRLIDVFADCFKVSGYSCSRLMAALVVAASLVSNPTLALSVEEATVADVQAAFLSGQMTAHQLVASYLERIEAYDKQGPYLNSIISLNPQALAEADALDEKLKRSGKLSGPLH